MGGGNRCHACHHCGGARISHRRGPALHLNRCPRARHPAAGCHRCSLRRRWDVVAAQAEATRGGARRRGKPHPLSGMRKALFPGPDGCAGAFLLAPRWCSWGNGGADEKGSRLAALAGFPDQPDSAPAATGRIAGRPVYSPSKGLMLASSRHRAVRNRARQPSSRWRQDQSPPGAGLTPSPSPKCPHSSCSAAAPRQVSCPPGSGRRSRTHSSSGPEYTRPDSPS